MKKSMFVSALFGMFLVGCATPSDQKAESKNSPITHNENGAINTNATMVQNAHRKVEEDIYLSLYQEHPEVVRYDRYTLVASSPNGGQKYLLEQLVQVNMLGKKKVYTLSVEQGLWHTLKQTGFTLCSTASADVKALFRLQLPKVHYQFGPMRLREALQMIAGEAYQLTVNDSIRQVCFERRDTLPNVRAVLPQVEATTDQIR